MTSIDWQGTTRKGQLGEVLYLFACRLAWRRHGDQRAQDELIRASQCADSELRAIAATFLDSPAYEDASPLRGRGKREGSSPCRRGK